MRPLLLAVVAMTGLAALSGCHRGLTIDQAYGRPDATEWTYFNVPAQRTLDAVRRFYSGQGVSTESARDEAGGVVLTLAVRQGSGDTGQILVQSTRVEGFQSRAQVYPSGRPVPEDLETYITRFQ